VYKYPSIFLLVFFGSIFFQAKAQPTLDTINNCLKQKPHLFGKIDTRNSFIDNSRAKILGVKAGFNFNDRLQFGIGYNQLYSSAKNFEKKIYYDNASKMLDSTTAKLRLFYFSLHTEYIYYQTKHWELSIPLQIGLGQTNYHYQQMGEKKTIEKNLFLIYEPSISVEYKIVKWFGVGSDIGFRFMAGNYKRLNQKFNSPTYAFKFLIYYDEIVKAFLKSKK
jgi:hypothetical protein